MSGASSLGAERAQDAAAGPASAAGSDAAAATTADTAATAATSAGYQRVCAALSAAGHPNAPVWLEHPGRTAAEAAERLGVALGQIAKSVIFRRRADERPVLVVTAGDRRVDEAKVAAAVGPIGRADAAFVRQRTGFVIGGVAPLAHLETPVALIDESLFRFDVIWAAAGHAQGVFALSPQQLVALTVAPVLAVTEDTAALGAAR